MMNSLYQFGADAPEDDEQVGAISSSENAMRERIARLEQQIEQLSQSIESCRKFILASRLLIAGGAILLVTIVVGAIRPDPLALTAAIAGVLGGIVLFGSNNSTAKQKNAALRAAEAERADLIGKIDLRLVGERGGTIWSHAN
jgi:hypothetical protein